MLGLHTKMAAASFRRICRPNFSRNGVFSRTLSTESASHKCFPWLRTCGCATGAILSLYLVNRTRNSWFNSHVYAKEALDKHADRAEGKKMAMQTQRELRFLSFASIEYNGNIYMTPQDFLESVTEEVPRPRTGRHRLGRDDIEKLLRSTPQRRKGSSKLFRNLHDKGIISYTEYLFLLCVLTKPRSGFRIAFNMFDTDGNQRVDKKEFLVLEQVLSAGRNERNLVEFFETFHKSKVEETEAVHHRERNNIWNIISEDPPKRGYGLSRQNQLEQIITSTKVDDRLSRGPDDAASSVCDTTLSVHFFGKKGNDVLKYEDFHSFMDNLQTEVLDLEFNEFSRGMLTITEEEFAKILLRYTILSEEEHEEYLQRLQERIPDVQGITFKDFKEFCQFLNNLDDFALAMRMYTFADKPISEEDFNRAVKSCTGSPLSPHLVHVVFQLFDQDGDGHLSHKEFVSVMKDRLHRGFRSSMLMNAGRWDNFKSCVKHEMKSH